MRVIIAGRREERTLISDEHWRFLPFGSLGAFEEGCDDLMTAQTRLIGAVVLAGGAMTGMVLAQGTGTPPPAQAPAAQTPAQPAPGRGADPGQRGAGQPGRQGGGGRRGGFTPFTRELAPPDVPIRGEGLYETNCAGCPAVDLRGRPEGTKLLRSGIALQGQNRDLGCE